MNIGNLSVPRCAAEVLAARQLVQFPGAFDQADVVSACGYLLENGNSRDIRPINEALVYIVKMNTPASQVEELTLIGFCMGPNTKKEEYPSIGFTLFCAVSALLAMVVIQVFLERPL